MDHFKKELKDRHNREYEAVKKIDVAEIDNWTYDFPPTLMQKLDAVRTRERRRYINSSAPGAGKSHGVILSAILEIDFRQECMVIFAPKAVLGTWVKHLKGGWDGNARISIKDYSIDADIYLVNYESLSSDDSASAEGLTDLIENRGVGMIVVDEAHKAKIRGLRDEDISTRRNVLEKFVGKAGEKRSDVVVSVLTATPIINNITEAKSILSLVEGKKLDDISDYNCVSSAVEINKHLTIHGIRCVPEYSFDSAVHKPILEMDRDESINLVRKVGRGRGVNYLLADQELLWTKLDWTVNKLREVGKAIIYCQYVDEVIDPLKKALEDEGFSVGVFSGDDKTGLKEFESGKVDVLIGSNSVGTGIDGLQHVCSDMIFISLPWTDADYQQAIGRILRKGQTAEKVDIWIPMVRQVCSNGEKVSIDGSRWEKIQKKAELSRMAVDGIFTGVEVEDAEVEKAVGQIIDMIRDGSEEELIREGIDSDLESLISEERIGIRRVSEFSRINALWNRSNSATTHARLQTVEGRKEWANYHDLWSEPRKSWNVVPAEVLKGWVGDRKGKRIADLGCGKMLMDPMDGKNEILGFDHVAHDDRVTECDISNVPLEDGEVFISVLCLSLMGSNYGEYISEARRITEIDGQVWIAETLTHVGNDEARIKESLESYGLNLIAMETQDRFVFMRCVKLEEDLDEKIGFIL